MISNMCHNNIFKHSHVLIIIFFLFQCVNISTSTTSPTFLGTQLVAKADKLFKCMNNERNALLGFKAMILGDPNDCLSSWGSRKEDVDDECCNWSGVTCNNQTGYVTDLNLHSCHLGGEISPSLLNLTSLTLLDLSFNSFHGFIPESIGFLTELTDLDLSRNSLNGSIPDSIGSLTELRYLSLSRNSFSGFIPESIGSLTELRYLSLSRNSFSGFIPESIGFLTELTDLDLSDNAFIGSIPKSIGSLTELTFLSLSSNSFSGNIPPEFGNLVNLEILYLEDIGRCSVENISWLSRLSHLKRLDMRGISLAKADHWVNAVLSLQNLTTLRLDECDLSQVMHPYSSSFHVNSSSSNIYSISLRNNSLNSSMYPWFYPLTSHNLYSLDLSRNKLDKFPKYLGNLCSLETLLITNNSAVVAFSDFLKSLSAGCTSATLVDLYASSSQFTGSISDDIQPFYSVENLDLSHNQLNGTISERLWVLPMLNLLNLSSNSLRGAIFEKISKSRIFYIDISSNNFSGKASILSTFNRSTVLDLSSNNFYGPVTNVSSSLNLLNLSKNNFYGGISFLCQIVDGSLMYLDLSHNSFFGQIPDCLWHFRELKLLNLAQNNLSGRLPSSFEYLIQLDVLDLYNNTFSGELPLSLRSCNKLTFLDLGANSFSGKLPVWIGENLSGLYVLSIGSNKLFGPIPLQFCYLVNLQILDLSTNNLDGTIPSCLSNLTSMIQQESLSIHNLHYYKISTGYGPVGNDYSDHVIVQWQGNRREFTSNLGLLKSIDLSSNNLTGKIPNELTDLHELLALNLSKNALFGEIPPKIGEMKELLTLDLSRNHFSGRIPSSLSIKTSLNYLDLSYNNLSGRIPSSTQLQSFNASTYTGNARLCGPPLSKYCPGDEESHEPSPTGEDNGIYDLERWFYTFGAIGFGIGFWIACGTLLVNRRGRHTFFRFMDTMEDWVYVKVMVFKAKFQVIP